MSLALGLVVAMSGPAVGEDYGSFGAVGRVSARTEVPTAPIYGLVNSGLAAMADGGWLRWKLVWRDGRPTAIEQMETLAPGAPAPPSWNLPAARPRGATPGKVEGETGCHMIGSGVTVRGRVGAWNCESAPGTLLGRLRTDASRVEARLPVRYQAMVAEAVPHGGVSRVILAGYDVAAGRFEYLELGVSP
ncbi:hypothetical protein [Phenylobacterium sp.]|uniref:hypothetical protein n=1 Tax=Phenylobacterium sp. TaxID=1871053 RepID=UPI002810A219|nr:hypothetical protein [Phenylobacterium sp.]